MAFVSYTQLAREVRNDLASGAWRTKSYYVGDTRHEYVDLDQITTFVEWLERKAQEEQGRVPRKLTVRGACGRRG